MSVRKIDGAWRYRIVVKLPDGNKVRISGTPEINTRAAAEREERLHVDRLKEPAPLFERYPRVDIRDFVSRWLDERAKATGNKSSTIAQRRSHLDTRIVPFFFREGHLVDVTTAHISEFRSKLLVELQPGSAASVMTTLALLLRDAFDAGALPLLPRMPAPIKVPEGKKVGLTDEEQAALLAACETDEERLTLIFALDTGARASEQLAVRWSDVDNWKRRIWIRRQRYMGETRETKTGVERYVDMTERIQFLLRMKKDREIDRATINDSSGYLFCDRFGRPRTYSHLASLLEKLRRRAKAAGVEVEGSWHKLRHTFASRCINRDVPPHVIQRWLGHTSLEHTMDYAHLDDGTGERFIKALD